MVLCVFNLQIAMEECGDMYNVTRGVGLNRDVEEVLMTLMIARTGWRETGIRHSVNGMGDVACQESLER